MKNHPISAGKDGDVRHHARGAEEAQVPGTGKIGAVQLTLRHVSAPPACRVARAPFTSQPCMPLSPIITPKIQDSFNIWVVL